MKSRPSSAPRLIRINWLDGSTTTHEGEFVNLYVRIYGTETDWCVGCTEVFVHTDCGPMWLDQRHAQYADDGRCRQADSSVRSARKGEGRVRKTTRKKTK